MTLIFQIVSPFKTIEHDSVSMVTLPGADGMLGVMPKHATCLVDLQPGIIKIYKNKDILKRYITHEGVANITPERCTVSVEEFHEIDDLDPKVLEENIKRYHNDLAGVDIEVEERILEAKIKATEKMLEVARQHFKK